MSTEMDDLTAVAKMFALAPVLAAAISKLTAERDAARQALAEAREVLVEWAAARTGTVVLDGPGRDEYLARLSRLADAEARLARLAVPEPPLEGSTHD